ncbi:MAG: phosphopentomutase, partial [Deltaproteobacteria bacterium]|nr:phosphopentomutase [Deltaproteobacteria bacterium]
NDAAGYARALEAADKGLEEVVKKLGQGDIMFITADHGCDPTTPSTDHSREYVPLLVSGASVRSGVNLATRRTFADIGATVLDFFALKGLRAGTSFLSLVS